MVAGMRIREGVMILDLAKTMIAVLLACLPIS